MPLIAYVFQQDVGANKAGDVVQLEADQAEALVDAGLLAEATSDDVGGEEAPAEEEVPVSDEAALTRAIQSGFKQLEKSLVKTAHGVANQKNQPTLGNFATPKQPVFKSMGELCKAQYKARQGSSRARNMLKAYEDEIRHKSPAGMSEGVAADGGYAVIPEWANEIFSKVKNLPRLLDMTDKQTISGNTLNIPAINETSLVDGSRGGGIRAYWVAEADPATTSYPAMTQVQAVLNTQVVMVPVTNQLLEDNAYNLDGFLAQKVGEEFTWAEDYAVISGSGTGQPKGIMNQAALVTIAKETSPSQVAASINFPNIRKMWAALYPASRANAVWLANPQVVQQLIGMTFPDANTTSLFPAFGGAISFNAHEEFPLRIFGKPVIECLMCPDLGLPGDLILCDLKQLTTAEHPGLEVAVSDQVYFTSLQTLFRFVRRYDIRSPWTGTLTDFNNHYAYSPFVVIASRGT